MPEGHTIHRLAKLHNRLLPGRQLAVTSPQGRFADGAGRVDGRTLVDVLPHGKHLFYRFDNDLSVHVHLGLHGSFRTIPMPPAGQPLPEPRGAVRMRLVGGPQIVELTGPTACHTLAPVEVKAIRDRLGPDVLDPAADAEQVWSRLSKSKSPVGLLLMDQSVVSGIGNVYRAEVLYRQKVHPLLPGRALKREQFDRIWTDARDLLAKGVRYGHIVTVDPADIDVPLAKATGDRRFLIYRRPTCRRCDGPVMQFSLAGRDCFYCQREQRRPAGVDMGRFAPRVVEPPKQMRRGAGHGDT